jgi:hypothetical protein
VNRTAIAFAATLALGGGAILLFPYASITPGVLVGGHTLLRNDCFACHAPLAGSSTEKCARCHRPADLGLRGVAGGPLAKASPRVNLLHRALRLECRSCHAEHKGKSRESAMVRFAHDLLPTGTRRDCASCHADRVPKDALHAGAGPRSQCSDCHGEKGWKPATYDHDRSFRFDRHHPARCADCHEPGRSLKEYSCVGCHEHSRAEMERKHAKERIGDVSKCARCHPSGNERDTLRDGRGGGESGRSHDDD